MTRRLASLLCVASWAIAGLAWYIVGEYRVTDGVTHAADLIGPEWQREALRKELAITDAAKHLPVLLPEDP